MYYKLTAESIKLKSEAKVKACIPFQKSTWGRIFGWG